MMAKEKNPPMDVEEENAEREQYGGLLKAEIESAASAIRTQKQKSSEVSGTLSGKMEIFEKKGGHKSALKAAERVTGMEPAECADWMRAFNIYFDALGGNDQLDMIDQQIEQDKNAASINSAEKSNVTSIAKPETAKEPENA